jgi:hypothetical protein
MTDSTNYQYEHSAALISKYCYYYQYDARKRMIVKKLPGADKTYMAYDPRDRLVAVQDGKFRDENPNKWLMTKYDALNRPALSLMAWSNNFSSRDSLQNKINIFYSSQDSIFYEDRINAGYGYTNNSFPDSGSCDSELLSVNYYDDYAFLSLSGFSGLSFNSTKKIDNYVDTDETNNGYFDRVKGLLTGSKSLIQDGTNSNWICKVSYYDDRYRPIQEISTMIFSGSISLVSTRYDFTGNVLETLETQTIGAVVNKFRQRMEYDHAGRLLHTNLYINNNDPVCISMNNYNELGELSARNLHSANQTTFLQSVNYTYNIRGWLKP